MKHLLLILFSIFISTSSFSQLEEELSQLPFDAIKDTIQKYSYSDIEKTITAANAYTLKRRSKNDLKHEWIGYNTIALSYYHNRMFKESSEQSENNMLFAQK